MGSFINPSFGYYEGDRMSLNDQEVPPRPAPEFTWVGGEWIAPPAPVPAAVTPLQARLALSAAGLLARVDQAATAAGGDVLLAWQYSSTVERGSPFVVSLAEALELTDEQVDDLFRSAATIT